MILDLISRLPLYGGLIPHSSEIMAAFQAQAPQSAPCKVLEKRYITKADTSRRFEVHDHTIDLMMARAGVEVIHICPEKTLTPAEPLPNGADGRKLDGAPQGSAIMLEQGWFCAIFPGEAHMVGGRINGIENEIDKWVVKVPIDRVP